MGLRHIAQAVDRPQSLHFLACKSRKHDIGGEAIDLGVIHVGHHARPGEKQAAARPDRAVMEFLARRLKP